MLNLMGCAPHGGAVGRVTGSRPPEGVGGATGERTSLFLSASTVTAATQSWDRWAAASQDLATDADSEAVKDCQRSLARLVKAVDRIPAADRERICRAAGLVVELDRLEEPGTDRFTPAAEVSKGLLDHWHERPGAGLPVVAWRRNDGSGKWDSLRPPEGLFAPATAVPDRLPDGRTRLRFLNPADHATVEVNGKPRPLAADFSAPVATLADHARALRRSAFEGMLDSRKIARREKMYLIQPYDPDRIPLLMIHGLKSTPVAFANLVNDLLADPEIRKHYQIWHYHYPTGTPVLMNAMALRRVLDETTRQLDPDGRDFAMRNMVVIGHSMGGVISHTLAADSAWALWDSAVSRRPEQLAGPASAIQVLRDLYVFQHHPAVKRVIFIAAPHRGSIYADNWLGNLGQKLLHADPAVIDALRPAVELNRAVITPFLVKLLDEGKVSSIRTLSGRSPALMALAGIRPSVPFHSIIGQKHEGPVEKGTDGFVAYASSHLEGAESELIVPSGHNAYRSPQAVAEVRRILLVHLRTGRAKP